MVGEVGGVPSGLLSLWGWGLEGVVRVGGLWLYIVFMLSLIGI